MGEGLGRVVLQPQEVGSGGRLPAGDGVEHVVEVRPRLARPLETRRGVAGAVARGDGGDRSSAAVSSPTWDAQARRSR